MHLYNIHTHNVVYCDENGYSVRCILNIFPSEFEKQSRTAGGCSFSCGVHPWHSHNADLELSLLSKLVADKRIVAIGETGLDKLQGAPLDVQMTVFRKQIELAMQLNKPLIIHCVKAWDELIALYKEYTPTVDCIIHGYRGKPQQAKQLLDLGFKFSIGAQFNKDTLMNIPLTSLFCETDISDTSIYTVYKNISDALNIDLKEFSETIEQNVNHTFYGS